MGKMIVRFPYLVCRKPVAKNHEAIYYDKYNWWVHRQCNNLCKRTYRDLWKTDIPLYCNKSIKDITPFSNLTDIELDKLINRKTLILKKLNENHESFLDQIKRLVKNDDVTDCKYYRLKLHGNNKKFSVARDMNIWSPHITLTTFNYFYI